MEGGIEKGDEKKEDAQLRILRKFAPPKFTYLQVSIRQLVLYLQTTGVIWLRIYLGP